MGVAESTKKVPDSAVRAGTRPHRVGRAHAPRRRTNTMIITTAVNATSPAPRGSANANPCARSGRVESELFRALDGAKVWRNVATVAAAPTSVKNRKSPIRGGLTLCGCVNAGRGGRAIVSSVNFSPYPCVGSHARGNAAQRSPDRSQCDRLTR